MKYRILTILSLFLGLTLSAQQPKVMWFTNNEANLGTVNIKESKDAVFYFENRGKKPFLILEAKSSCGCTSPKYKKKPILVGERDSVVVKFKPNDKGIFYKKVEIKNSVGEKQILVIRGNVE